MSVEDVEIYKNPRLYENKILKDGFVQNFILTNRNLIFCCIFIYLPMVIENKIIIMIGCN